MGRDVSTGGLERSAMRKLEKALAGAALAAMVAGLCPAAHAAEVKREIAGTLADGTQVSAITPTADNGISATVLSYGATLQKLLAPDSNGRVDRKSVV